MPFLCELGFHQWKPEYVKQDSCATQETCKRCRKTRGTVKIQHQWEWLYPKPNSCVKQEFCTRCKAVGQTDNTGLNLWKPICIDEDRKERFVILQQAINNLAQAAKLWYIADETEVWDSRRYAGASNVITRESAKVIRESLPHTNILIYGISFSGRQLFFLPDSVSVLQGQNLKSLDPASTSTSYDGLTASSTIINFRETEPIPADSKIFSYTWQYVRVDGGPDRRFSYNPRIPVVRYGQIELLSQTGLVLRFYSSNATYAQEVVSSLRSYIRVCTTPSFPRSRKSKPHQNEKVKPEVNSNLAGKSPYEILGVKAAASMEEITSAYRKLAQENHPDKVAGLAPEFRELAESRMKIINAAYEQLKRTYK
jgi:hypothetical protein